MEIIQRMRACYSKDKDDKAMPGYLSAAGDRRKNLRTYGIGAQILSDMEKHTQSVLSAPKSMHGISGFDLEVVEYVECR